MGPRCHGPGWRNNNNTLNMSGTGHVLPIGRKWHTCHWAVCNKEQCAAVVTYCRNLQGNLLTGSLVRGMAYLIYSWSNHDTQT